MTVLRKLLLACVAVGMTVLGLLLAVYALGPAVRRLFGVPEGFEEDFTSPAALHQAFVVQAISVGLAFFLFGIASKKLLTTNDTYSDAVWMGNPATVGFGFIAYKCFYHELYPRGYLAEYDNLLTLVIFALAAPVVFAGCFYLGSNLRPRKSRSALK